MKKVSFITSMKKAFTRSAMMTFAVFAVMAFSATSVSAQDYVGSAEATTIAITELKQASSNNDVFLKNASEQELKYEEGRLYFLNQVRLQLKAGRTTAESFEFATSALNNDGATGFTAMNAPTDLSKAQTMQLINEMNDLFQD